MRKLDQHCNRCLKFIKTVDSIIKTDDYFELISWKHYCKPCLREMHIEEWNRLN